MTAAVSTQSGIVHLGLPAPECTTCTPLRPLAFERELASHPDKDFAANLVHGIKFGFKIGYDGPQFTRINPNLTSASLNPHVIDDTLRKECAAGRLGGPFPHPPLQNFRSSGIGLVPKKGGGWRMIHHLSAPAGSSINDFIDPEAYTLSYVTVDKAAAILTSLGPGTLMAKMDLRSAFRQCPVHPSDWNLLGLQWRDAFYFDKCLPFGLRSAPLLFDNIGKAVEWIARRHGVTHLMRYLDDFLTFGRPNTPECSHNISSLIRVCDTLHIPINFEKTTDPSTRLEFLGILLDSVRLELSITVDRKQELITDLHSMLHRRTCKKRLLLQLIGKLSFACKVIPAGRIFLRRLINKSTEVGPMHHHITMDTETRADLQWWLAFLPPWPGISAIINLSWCPPSRFQLFTDASKDGFGAYWDGRWFAGPWPDTVQQYSINWKELYAIVLAASTWGHLWCRQSILVHCDNSSVVDVWHKGSSRLPCIMGLVRVLYFIAAMYEFHVSVHHIPGTNNAIADSLSRSQVERFRSLAPQADAHPTPVVDPHSHSTQYARTYGIFSHLP